MSCAGCRDIWEVDKVHPPCLVQREEGEAARPGENECLLPPLAVEDRRIRELRTAFVLHGFQGLQHYGATRREVEVVIYLDGLIKNMLAERARDKG